MKLQELHIRDFKRFADLTISGLPETVKLVLLTGPNGSGKTSLFEAFNYWMGMPRGEQRFDAEYHSRMSAGSSADAGLFGNNLEIKFHGVPDITKEKNLQQKAFYIRSAYRNEPDFTSNGLSATDNILNNSRRAFHLIHPEQRVSENYQRILGETILALYTEDHEAQNMRGSEIAYLLIGEVREVVKKVFDDLLLQGPGNPIMGGTFRFKKGVASGFHYKNLSGGEKAAFDLLLDFIVKRRAFDDTVFCVDEPELHMHTKLQARFMEVVFSLIPDSCQLWLSTHSIGMARKAAELYEANPNQVAFIDFHDKDFDQPTSLSPISPDRPFWKKMFSTTLDDLAELVVPKYVVFCEGKRIGGGGRKPSFDVEIYKAIFSDKYPDVEFVPLGGTTEVQHDEKAFGILLHNLAPGVRTWKVFDRDDRAEQEIKNLKNDGVHVLDRRDLESYLWDEEVLAELCRRNNATEKLQDILNEKSAALKANEENGQPSDDIKKISGPLYNKCKTILSLTQCGNNAEAFAIYTLAPCIVPGMVVYEELKVCVLSPRIGGLSESS